MGLAPRHGWRVHDNHVVASRSRAKKPLDLLPHHRASCRSDPVEGKILAKYVNDPFTTGFFIPTATPTRDYAALALGSSAVFKNDLSGFAQFSAALGLKDATNYGLVIGLRKQF